MGMKKGKVLIVDPEKFDKQKKKLKSDGAQNLQVISDFDRTITQCFVGEKRAPSLIGLLREKNYLSKNYTRKAQELFTYYHRIEIDPKIPLKLKRQKMLEWWKRHFSLLIEYNLTRDIVYKVMNEADFHLRSGGQEFFNRLSKKHVPLIIFSAGGLGRESIQIFLKKRGLFLKNTYIVANNFIWDKKGNLLAIESPIIHVYNKDETILKKFDFYNKVKNRKNLILLGDSLGDAKMANGMSHDEVIKIGFLNEDNREHLKYYSQLFDLVIIGDASFYFVNQLLKDVFN
jgi:cytosolic 5'-nucleotidase 3